MKLENKMLRSILVILGLGGPDPQRVGVRVQLGPPSCRGGRAV